MSSYTQCEVFDSEGAGRGLRATADLAPGTPVCVDPALAVAVCDRFLLSNCRFCLQPSAAVCPKCRLVSFCEVCGSGDDDGGKCRAAHATECGVYAEMRKRGWAGGGGAADDSGARESRFLRLLLQILLQASAEAGASDGSSGGGSASQSGEASVIFETSVNDGDDHGLDPGSDGPSGSEDGGHACGNKPPPTAPEPQAGRRASLKPTSQFSADADPSADASTSHAGGGGPGSKKRLSFCHKPPEEHRVASDRTFYARGEAVQLLDYLHGHEADIRGALAADLDGIADQALVSEERQSSEEPNGI